MIKVGIVKEAKKDLSKDKSPSDYQDIDKKDETSKQEIKLEGLQNLEFNKEK